jgi:uncharacterized protein
MGNPVIHFEVVGKDGARLRKYYSELFDWEMDANNPMEYGIIDREANLGPNGEGIGGGVGQAPEGYDGHAIFYAGVDDVEAALAKAESLGGTRLMGPSKVMEGVVVGLFADPEGHRVGVVSDS